MEQLLKSKYRIGNKLAENPFSVTYQGFFIGTEKPVVIKIYKRGTLNSSLIKIMKQKVLALSLLNHHGVAKLLDGDYGWQGFYYVREHVNGFSLQDLLDRQEKAGVDKACAVMDQALAALQVAHEKGIVHAGLKPGNIFIDGQGLVKLTDFVVEGEIKAALPQKVEELMGGAQYASPEELQGRPVTPSSDLYSLGLILLEMATGKPLPRRSGLAGPLAKLQAKQVIPKEELAPLPAYLREIILCATEKEPLRRFATAQEFQESLAKHALIRQPQADEEFVRIYESVVTQYGGEVLDKESEALQDVGRVRLRWGKEKHRNWILAVVAALAVALGILYAFFLGL
jgi:serine/threonine protein kinase